MLKKIDKEMTINDVIGHISNTGANNDYELYYPGFSSGSKTKMFNNEFAYMENVRWVKKIINFES
jgi:hypothetical protein